MGSVIQPGVVIEGKYRVGRRIGEGGMGTVYEGENIRIERRVAIKVLHEHVASSPEFAQRFEREARASGRIGSPHVCDVLDLGDLENGERYIVMEFLDGESLEDRLKKGKLTTLELAPIAFEILEGLGTMHQAGVIHRDLKPANIFLARGRGARAESVKILDFGVAKINLRADEIGEMTSTGVMMGTPLYMSPEQARGARDVDGRTDLYAASVIFYRALTGTMPHSGLNLHELLFKIALEDPRPIAELAPGVDDVFAAIVTKGLARDHDLRYGTAREYQDDIAAWGHQQGSESLKFAVMLSAEPPPIRSIGPALSSAAAIKAQGPITGPGPRAEKMGPPTPALGKTQRFTELASPLPGEPGNGTPIVWSEDASQIAKQALAGIAPKKTKATWRSPGTEPLENRLSPEAPVGRDGTPAEPASKAEPGRRRASVATRLAFGVGAVALIALGVLGARLAGQAPSASNASAGSASSAPPAVEAATKDLGVTPSPPPGTGATTPAASNPTVLMAMSATASAAPVNTPSPARTAAVTAVPSKPVTPAPAKTLPLAPSATVASPAPTSSVRKFRTNLE